MRIVAVIPIKLNNERLPGKNTVLMSDGKPLISHILDTISHVSLIDEVYVYCSDAQICDYLPPNVIFLSRPTFLDSKETNFTQIFNQFMLAVDADVYVYTHATSPLIRKETIDDCIHKVLSGEYDSATTVKEIKDFLWIDGMPNYDVKNIPRSQDIAPIYQETSGVYVFTKQSFLNNGSRIGSNPYFHVVTPEESVDINYKIDLDLANALLQNQ